MHLRKLQLIAGTTYSVSLPKEWVKDNNLKEKSTISIKIKNDNSLLISPKVIDNGDVTAYTLDMDEYDEEIDQILFSLFYSGFQDITLRSSKGISPEVNARIKRTLANMSGTEVVYEDDNTMNVKVLLNTDNLELNQIFFRLYLLIRSSISYLKKGADPETIKINEDEIDRLFHLVVKLISISSSNPEDLSRYNMGPSSNIISYFLIAKRLEHLGDNLNHMSKLISSADIGQVNPILEFVEEGIKLNIDYLTGAKGKMFRSVSKDMIDEYKEKINSISNYDIRVYLLDSIRCVQHIGEELVNISFNKRLADTGVLQ